MEKHHVNKLSSSRSRIFLINNLKLSDDFLQKLLRTTTITASFIEELNHEKDRLSYFLDYLIRRGDRAYDNFINALIDTSQERIVEELEPKFKFNKVKKLDYSLPTKEITENPLESSEINELNNPRMNDLNIQSTSPQATSVISLRDENNSAVKSETSVPPVKKTKLGGKLGRAYFFKSQSNYLDGLDNDNFENLSKNLWDEYKQEKVDMVRTYEELTNQLNRIVNEPDQLVLFICMDGKNGLITTDSDKGTIKVIEIIQKINDTKTNKLIFLLFSLYQKGSTEPLLHLTDEPSDSEDEEVFKSEMNKIQNLLDRSNINNVVVIYSEKKWFNRNECQYNWLLSLMLRCSGNIPTTTMDPSHAFLKLLKDEIGKLREEIPKEKLKETKNRILKLELLTNMKFEN